MRIYQKSGQHAAFLRSGVIDERTMRSRYPRL
jgi:hypothetical protein